MTYWQIRRWSASAIVLTGLFSTVTTTAAEPLKITKEQAKLVGIETAKLSETANVASLGFLARVVIPPRQVRQVTTMTGGRVNDLLIAPGQVVKQGQPLAQITSSELLKAQLEFVQALAQEQFLKETLAREQTLSQDRIVSSKQIQTTRTELTVASSTVTQRRAALQMSGMSDAVIAALAASRAPSGVMSIQAPMDGTVVEVAVSTGQSVEATAPFFRIAQLSPLWLELQVSSAQIARVELGAEVQVPGLAGKGRITAIGSTVDPANQAITVRAEIDNADGRLRPGQMVETRVRLMTGAQKYWSVPPSSLVRMGKDTLVLKEIEGGYLPVAVQIHHEAADTATITGDLESDDRIAIRGLVALKGAMRGLGGGE